MSQAGKNIRKIRTIKGLSQTAFAKMFDLSRAAVGSYEEGRAEPKLDVLIQIADHYGLSLDDLLSRELSMNELIGFNNVYKKLGDKLGRFDTKKALDIQGLSGEKRVAFLDLCAE